MSYLIDTNVLSELRRKQPDPNVVAWMQARPRQSLFLSVLTLGEIRKGLERVEDATRKQSLLDWLEVELPNYFVGRMLVVDAHTADRWGRLMAQAASEMDGDETRRRQSAIAHLKAAVAATEADRAVTGGRSTQGEERMEPYRDDLDRVVRPRRPQAEATTPRPPAVPDPAARPTPLVLVSAQRIDQPRPAAPPPSTTGSTAPRVVLPVRPRRPALAHPCAAPQANASSACPWPSGCACWACAWATSFARRTGTPPPTTRWRASNCSGDRHGPRRTAIPLHLNCSESSPQIWRTRCKTMHQFRA